VANAQRKQLSPMGIPVKTIAGLLSVAAVSSILGPAAHAADMPLRALPPPPPVFSWTGFYVGGNVDYNWQSSSATWAAAGALPGAAGLVNGQSFSTGASSMSGGFHGGFNWQFASAWVAGIEGDYSFTKAGGGNPQPWINAAGVVGAAGPTQALTGMTSTLDNLATVRGRLGFLVLPTVMLYGTGGGAWGKISEFGNAQSNIPGSLYLANSTFSSTASGWVAGGGLEWMFWHNWTVRWEYLHYDLSAAQNVSVVGTAAGGAASTVSTFGWSGMKVDEVRAGLSYKF
jgi:outer membrane immunogenic protein